MTAYGWTWFAIVAAGLLAWGIKYAGHSVPESWLEKPRVHRIAGYVTIALLSALTAVQAFTTKGGIAVDSRVVALAVAAVLLWRRAPFIVVVVLASATTAVLRQL